RRSVFAELPEQLAAVARRLAEQDGTPHRGRPRSVAAAEQRGKRRTKLLDAKRVVLEERQLPAVESLSELRVLVRGEETGAQLAGKPAAERVQARRLAGRL